MILFICFINPCVHFLCQTFLCFCFYADVSSTTCWFLFLMLRFSKTKFPYSFHSYICMCRLVIFSYFVYFISISRENNVSFKPRILFFSLYNSGFYSRFLLLRHNKLYFSSLFFFLCKNATTNSRVLLIFSLDFKVWFILDSYVSYIWR